MRHEGKMQIAFKALLRGNEVSYFFAAVLNFLVFNHFALPL